VLTDKVGVRSAEEYANLVAAHAELSIGQCLYPGQNYANLATYMQRAYSRATSINVSEDPKPLANFVSLHDLSLPENDASRIQHFSRIDEFEKTFEEKRKETKPSLLLFLTGYPSPE
jgi:hypothetical protein